MTLPPLSCRSWLPASALRTSAIDRLVDQMLRAWSAKWLARSDLRRIGPITRVESSALDGEGWTWFAIDDALALRIGATTSSSLVRSMLDVSDVDSPTTDADRRIVETLARKALDDLMRSLLEFHPGGGTRWTEMPAGERPPASHQWECRISLGTHATLLFAMSDDAVIAAIKGSLPRPKQRPLHSLGTALGAQTIGLSARLGCTRISLNDLANLAVGDVLILDSALADASTVTIDGRPREGLGCSVERQTDAFTLTMLQPLHGAK